MPYWDFRLPKDSDDAPRDSSAAAIAASGLLEIASLVGEGDGLSYKHAAEEILISLHNTYTQGQEQSEGLLLHGTGYYMKDIYVDASLIYGDYYYVEALLKLKYA